MQTMHSPIIDGKPVAGGLSAERLIAMHKSLLRIRSTEETIARRYREQEMRTPTHLGSGQEAVAVGVAEALREGDVVYSHHRAHNHYLACGGSVAGLAAELYGRVDGCSRGRGGSVHLTAPDKGFIVSSAIVGETAAVAVGSALAFKMDKADRVAVTFFGDAALEEGILYESFNYAALRKLPVIFVCENNLYSTESPLSVRQPEGTSLCARAESFTLAAKCVDGNDVLAVWEAAAEMVARAREGGGPSFLECRTYRWREHVGPQFDWEAGRSYRSREELEEWLERCPVKTSGARLAAMGLATPAELQAWEQHAFAEAEAVFEEARTSPWPEPGSLFENA